MTNNIRNTLAFVCVFMVIMTGCSQQEQLAMTGEDAIPALIPAPRDQDNWWVTRHEAKLEEEGRETADLLFLGDSITQGWEGAGEPIWDNYYQERGAYNIGYSGDRTEHVLWRLQHGEVDGINPDVAILMIGTNNTGQRQDPPGDVYRGIEMILNELKARLPETRILMLAIFPRGAQPDDPLRLINDEINERITTLADNERVYFADINDTFLGADGELSRDIMPDYLHPNRYGYELWAQAMEPALTRLLNMD